MEIKIRDAFSASILGVEEAIWALQDLVENNQDDFSESEFSDVIAAKELSQSARDLCVLVMKQYTKRKKTK